MLKSETALHGSNYLVLPFNRCLLSTRQCVKYIPLILQPGQMQQFGGVITDNYTVVILSTSSGFVQMGLVKKLSWVSRQDTRDHLKTNIWLLMPWWFLFGVHRSTRHSLHWMRVLNVFFSPTYFSTDEDGFFKWHERILHNIHLSTTFIFSLCTSRPS